MPANLEELIRNKEIEFFSYGRKLNADIEDFGKYNLDLVKHLLKNVGNKISLKGSGLENYLTKPQNLYIFADFLTKLHYQGAKKYSDIAFQVNADIEKFGQHYQQPKEEKIVNILGEVVCDATGWVSEMPYFEKLWNFSLDWSIGGMFGSGYNHPRSDAEFRALAARLAEIYLIGTPQQIQRYKKYALDALSRVMIISDELKNNPEAIFEESDKLYSLWTASRHARILARNVEHFSIDQH